MEDREKAIIRLRKLKALAERGVGGEKTGAQKAYGKLKAKCNITDTEVEETLPPPKKRRELSMAMDFLVQQIQDEIECCRGCEYQRGDDFCRGCGTSGNITDLERQYEQMAAELEGRAYG